MVKETEAGMAANNYNMTSKSKPENFSLAQLPTLVIRIHHFT